MKKWMILSIVALLATSYAQATEGLRPILTSECRDSEGNIISESGFDYTGVMNISSAAMIGFSKKIDGCTNADFISYLVTSSTVVNDEKTQQIEPANPDVLSKDCKAQQYVSERTIFQKALVYADRIVLTTERCAELTLTLGKPKY